MLVNQKRCDYRAYFRSAIFANIAHMDTIDGKWIARRLTGRHGEKAAIARHMRIAPHELSKILKGTRRVQADELPLLLDYFSLRLTEDRSTPDDDLAQIAEKLETLNEDGRQALLEHLDLLSRVQEYRR